MNACKGKLKSMGAPERDPKTMKASGETSLKAYRGKLKPVDFRKVDPKPMDTI